jgi:transcriptional regulator GlxA family with amidase domain
MPVLVVLQLMSRRTFTRQFGQLIGMTVVEWLHAERLALTQRLLESSDHSVDTISSLVGFGSPESLRLHFRRAFGVSPTAWRSSFKGCAIVGAVREEFI